MKKDKDNWLDMAPDALLGYSVIVLCIICFFLALAVIIAGVRFLIGPGVV